MHEILPREVREGLEMARLEARRRSARLRVQVGADAFPILRFSEDGFTLDAEDAPRLRGHVDIYDGATHLCQALIIAAELTGDRMSYEFKRATPHMDQPPRDYMVDEAAPVALIARH